MKRLAASVALVLIAALLPGVALASVEEAQQAVDAAEADLAASEELLAFAELDLNSAQMRVARAISSYRSVTLEAERAAFDVAEIIQLVTDAEADVAQHRFETRQRTVAAYMDGGSSAWDLFFVAGTFEEYSAGRAVLDRAAGASLAAADEAATDAAELADLRARLDAALSQVERLRWDSDRALAEAALALDAAAEVTQRADGRVNAADGLYQEAVTELEEAIARRNARGANVENWRSLVEEHFAPELIEQALDVMYCESRGNPLAVNPESGATGLFQFMEGTWRWVAPRAGYPQADRTDPVANIVSAAYLVDYSIRTNHRWGAWGRWSCRRVVE